MSGRLAILGAGGPSVVLGELDALRAHGNHRLNSDDHTLLEECSGTLYTKVRHIGRLMHLETYAMAAKLADHPVTVLLSMRLDSMSNITYAVARLTFLKTQIEALFSNLQKSFHLRRNLAHGESESGVCHISVEFNHTVERYIVAFLDEKLTRNTMNHNIVDGDAECRREALEALTKGFCSVVTDELLTYLVKEGGSDTRTDVTANLRESFPEEEAGITYELDFFFCLQQYHFLER
jgi:hypothetical protein